MTDLQELGSAEKDLHGSLVVMVLIKFLYLFAASMFLGLAFGLGTSFLMKRFKSNSVPQVSPPNFLSVLYSAQSCVSASGDLNLAFRKGFMSSVTHSICWSLAVPLWQTRRALLCAHAELVVYIQGTLTASLESEFGTWDVWLTRLLVSLTCYGSAYSILSDMKHLSLKLNPSVCRRWR